ncbi:MAG: type IV pilus assembly protein PilM [Planctomycetaceae bacterium]
MAETSRSVWGIDIGQYALKALKIRYLEGAGQVAAVAFDYVPFPKILSQPDAVPEELIPEAINTFLSRNQVKNDLIAISVPGHSALTRFIQLPPVEAGKVAEIVKYEARQQIPFALEEVIWDFQRLGSGIEESGYLLDAEVGLFAMKRDQVMQQLRPFQNAKLEVELIQIAPLGLFNYLCYDELGVRPGENEDGSDEYSIVLDMGCDNTTLMVSNGAKIWIRNVPLGGNHFTRALTKEMKLSFAKAEHLKCNATKSDDPRAVFQALRPVFNDYVSEIQRSIGFFSSVNRSAKISKVIGVGNGFKLAGLQKFLQQNLQYEVERPDTFKGLAGDAVLNSPLFADNVLSFAVPYGIALQTLGLTTIRTTLLPPEIKTERIIRKKKPWAVAAAATLLAGLSLAAVPTGNAYRVPHRPEFTAAEQANQEATSHITTGVGAFTAEKSRLDGSRDALNDFVTGRRDARWLEVFKSIDDCLPRDTGVGADPQKEIPLREQISIVQIDNQHVADVGTWFTKVQADRLAEGYIREWDKTNPPTGEGYIFSIHGIHYHNEPTQDRTKEGILYVRDTLLDNLKSWTVTPKGSQTPQPVGQLGIRCPTIVNYKEKIPVSMDAPKKEAVGGTRLGGRIPRGLGPRGRPGINPGFNPGYMESNEYSTGAPQGPYPTGPQAGGKDEKMVYLDQTWFVIQFIWQYVPEAEREPAAPWETSAAAGADTSDNFDPTSVAPAADGSAPPTEGAATDPATDPGASAAPAEMP